MSFLEKTNLNEWKQKWVSKVQVYNFDIEYVKGKMNVVVDALPMKPTTCSLIELSEDWKGHLSTKNAKNQFLCTLINKLIQDDRYKIVDDIIYYKDKIYLVHEFSLKERILKVMHDVPLVGNKGCFKTYRQIREEFSWKGIKEDVMKYVEECVTCQ